MLPPSTDWREITNPDEAQRFDGYAATLKEIQRKRNAKYGTGRALHRKQLIAARGRLEVLTDLPVEVAHGLFALPANYDVTVRLSNGSMNMQSDRVGDIRGYAIKVHGVTGESALGGPATAQDFLLINRVSFGMRDSAAFMGFVLAASNGLGSLIMYFIRNYGFFAGLARLRVLKDGLSTPFGGFANVPFNSVVPVRCGPYAMRVRLCPATTDVDPAAAEDWAADIHRRLKAGPLVHALQVQLFVDEQTTPIEDASVAWSESHAPFVTVGRLTLPQQDTNSAEGQQRARDAEAASFDPWTALVEHTPLGDVNRARKVAYYESAQARAASSSEFA